MSCKFVAYLYRKVKKVAAKQILLLPTNIPWQHCPTDFWTGQIFLLIQGFVSCLDYI